MEGKFSREGLQSLDEDDDMLTAMARELVTESGVGESAAAVWRQIQAEHINVVIPATITPEPASIVEDAPRATSLVETALTMEVAANDLKFGTRPLSERPPLRRRAALPVGVQFPVF